MVVVDETGWRVNRRSAWLWVTTTPQLTLSKVAAGRGFDQARQPVAGDYDGVLVRDGWVPYRSYTHATHQPCLAHLLRRWDELAEDLPGDRRAGTVEHLTDRLDLLLDGAHPQDECRTRVAHLARERDAPFTFLARPGVDATNWRAEHAYGPPS